MLGGLTDLYALAPLEEFPKRVLSLVHRLVGCDAASYNEIDVTTGQFRALIDPADSVSDEISPAFERFVHQHPVIAHVANTGDLAAHTISDFLRPIEFHRLGLHGEFFGPLGFEDQLSTTLSVARGERIIGVALNRSGTFAEQDRLVLDTMRPHFVTAYQNAMHYSDALSERLLDHPFTGKAAASLDRLTDRQCEVLRLITQGYTNFKVAAELNISVGTVKKHVEHILERLQLSTRVGAARVYLTGLKSLDVDQWWNVTGAADHQITSRHP